MANTPVCCGVDIGTTNVKALLIDAEGRTCWSRSRPVPRVLADGQPATDAAALVATLEGLIIEGWRACGAGAPLAAIATTGIGEDGLPVNGSLAPLDLALPWFDRRAEPQAAALRPLLEQPVRAGVSIDATRTVAKWRWLRTHRPAVLRTAAAWITLTDYPAVHWSRTPFISETLAARTGAYDVFARRWLADHLERSGAPDLPYVLRAGQVVGRMAEGALIASGAADRQTCIVAGGHDHPVAASVVRRLDPAAIVDSLGTANLMYGETADLRLRADPWLAFSVPVLGGAGLATLGVYAFAEALAPWAGPAGQAALRDFLAHDRAPGLPGRAEAILGALRPTAGVPATCGDVADTVALRTVLEASCCHAARMLQALRAAGVARGRLHAVGGWARSRALVQLRASLFGQPIHTVDEDELTALGAALIARQALSGLPTSVHRAVHRIDPLPEWQAAYAPVVRAVLHALEQAPEAQP